MMVPIWDDVGQVDRLVTALETATTRLSEMMDLLGWSEEQIAGSLEKYRCVVSDAKEWYEVRTAFNPVVVERACGGWIATSPDGCPHKLGVTADTPQEAEAKWRKSYARVREIMKMPPIYERNRNA